MKYHIKITKKETDEIILEKDVQSVAGAIDSGSTVDRFAYANANRDDITLLVFALIREAASLIDGLKQL